MSNLREQEKRFWHAFLKWVLDALAKGSFEV